MEAIIEFFELSGVAILFFTAGLLFARISGYGKFYDKMLYDKESDAYITIKESEDSEDSIIHQFYI